MNSDPKKSKLNCDPKKLRSKKSRKVKTQTRKNFK